MSNNPINEGKCRFQENVDCSSIRCARCGWNPRVANARIKAWQAKRLNEKKPEDIS